MRGWWGTLGEGKASVGQFLSSLHFCLPNIQIAVQVSEERFSLDDLWEEKVLKVISADSSLTPYQEDGIAIFGTIHMDYPGS